MQRASIILSMLALLCCSSFAQHEVVADPPEISTPFALTAIYDAGAGHNAFTYAGRVVPPTIRVLPGGAINLEYVNNECCSANSV